MALNAIPASGTLVWVWFTPVVAAIESPAVSPVAAMAAAAAIHRRMRRLIATSVCSVRPAVWGRRWFEAASGADGWHAEVLLSAQPFPVCRRGHRREGRGQ